ncbi:hypothetical protein Lfu02_05490 [Longispora fulva]|uniref:Uncharacterized protein n=1 Tax=Longispora fulva TaxID=619741 RepID=A0A8J7GM60_9ACTN|nr:hypothetical protein [Longispora fulva]MBG6135584.1 hypothetical protein [Longispora fulva]GIG56177.1 hypothetical protein Lfu02_05490 [Longispora fulva]
MTALAVLLTTAVLPTGPAAAAGSATEIAVVAVGLNAPRGLAVGLGDVVYVTNRTMSAGGAGQLLKLTLHQ